MRTDISVILDRSGSMQSIASDTIGGFNRFLSDQKAQPGEATFSLVQFDDQFEVVHVAQPIKGIQPLTPLTFVPRGSTALLDAIGRTINASGARFSAMSEAQRPEKVICVIVTDGQENASREFTLTQINEMITHQRATYQWEFVFLGANQDAIAVASHMGIAAGASMSYTASKAGTAATYDAVSNYVSTSRGGLNASFSDDDRKKAIQE